MDSTTIYRQDLTPLTVVKNPIFFSITALYSSPSLLLRHSGSCNEKSKSSDTAAVSRCFLGWVWLPVRLLSYPRPFKDGFCLYLIVLFTQKKTQNLHSYSVKYQQMPHPTILATFKWILSIQLAITSLHLKVHWNQEPWCNDACYHPFNKKWMVSLKA